MFTNRILLACGSDWQAPARLPRLFRQAGCQVTIFSSSDWGITKTKFVDDVCDAPRELDAYIDALRSHLTSKPGKYSWIVAVDDPLLEQLALRNTERWVREILPIAHADLVGILANKAEFSTAAGRLGLPTPESRACDDLREATIAANEVGYPVVLKLAASYAGMGVRRADDDAELARMWGELHAERRVVVQKFVTGRLGNTAALFSRGVPICFMSAFKARTWPGEFGPSSARQFMHHDAIEPILARFGRGAGYDGFGAIDWILDRDGCIHVIEFNARPVPALHMGVHAGVDFARAISDFLRLRLGDLDVAPTQRPNSTIEKRAILPMFPEDFHRAITDADEGGMAEFLPGSRGYDDIPWDDPPLLAHLLRRRSTKRAFDKLFGADALAHQTNALLKLSETS